MLRAVLIDDERPAIRELEYFLKEYPILEVTETFINPLEAIEKLAVINPELVFLDINMPQLQGMDAASRILDLCPDSDIIFVTAYDHYAVEAFELHALDYLLKPLSTGRFHKTIQRVLAKNHFTEERLIKKLRIKGLGSFEIGWDGKESIKWRSEKTKELFAFLLHKRGQIISKDVLLETLWFDCNVEKAVHQLHNGIYYIRKTLKEHGIDRSLIKIEGNYCLQVSDDVELDIENFQKQYAGLNEAENKKEMERLLALYNGEYMGGSDWNWAELEREMYAKQYSEINLRLAKMHIENKDFARAENCLLNAYKQDPFDESITILLLELYKMTGDKIKATKHFSEYVKLLKEELGIEYQGDDSQRI